MYTKTQTFFFACICSVDTRQQKKTLITILETSFSEIR